MAAPQHVCPTASFLPGVRGRMYGLDAQIMSTLDNGNFVNLINDIRPMFFNWKNGGLCPNCAVNAAKWNFASCLAEFDRITNGDYDDNANSKMFAIRIAMSDFNNKLDAFEQFYQNCL